ncbi:ATP-binding protein [Mesobacterium sp. TK19101]|uniref:histidine kinase n=1 Tax=Mesobacterium hydrothermale TaxID=3111907 RepID=A0ABU6HML7_9RHOB|nr:ATP-binding protein [Mesobacterium sp. TK19101]MEC3863106.1 ATP-binding protein [Mesobacterium sp. TK19101]
MNGLLRLRLPSAMGLALRLSVVFALSSVAAGGVAWVVIGDELKARLFRDAELEAKALSAELQTSGEAELKQQIRHAAAFGEDFSNLYYFAPAGGANSTGNMRVFRPASGNVILRIGTDADLVPRSADHQGDLYFGHGIRTPAGWIVVARDQQWIADSQEVMMQSVAWGLAIAFLITVSLAYFSARRNARRVEELNEVLRSVSAGDLSARYKGQEKESDDLSEVADGLNQMLGKLQENVERLTQVSADIAHDLRSPLTRIRLWLEPLALRDDIDPDTREAIGRSLVSVQSMSETFDAILQLAQLETGNLTLETQAADVQQIAANVVEMLSPVAEDAEKSIALNSEGTELLANLNPELVTQALVNLADNALRHSPAGTRITVEVTPLAGGIRLCVSDNGPGIPEPELEKVKRRFYRLDRSRNQPGTGLGLSLVDAIAELHGGTLELSDNKPGLRACLTLRGSRPRTEINR